MNDTKRFIRTLLKPPYLVCLNPFLPANLDNFNNFSLTSTLNLCRLKDLSRPVSFSGAFITLLRTSAIGNAFSMKQASRPSHKRAHSPARSMQRERDLVLFKDIITKI
jgi:hypothetical protein